MIEVKFTYKDSIISLQCIKSDIMKNIFEKYITKTGLDITKLVFLYGGKKISNELSLNELNNTLDDQNNILNILVIELEEKPETKCELKKSNNIICSKCQGTCRLEIENYKIKLYGCKKGHVIKNILVNNFQNTQYIDESKIICDKCKSQKIKQYNKQFYNCNVCKLNLCPLCKSIHDKRHNIVDYDKKNYEKHFFCKKHHNEKFFSYCYECKKDLCLICETEHDKEHKIESYKNITYTKEHLNTIVRNFQERIKIVYGEIEEIIDIMKKMKENIEKYNEIFCHILKNYEIENRNYNILKNINVIIDNDIFQDIIHLSDNTDIYFHFKILTKMYKNMNINNNSAQLIKYFELEQFKNARYSQKEEIQSLYQNGEKSICKILNNNQKFLATGLFILIEQNLGVPIKKALLTCNKVFPDDFFKNNKYLYFNHKGENKKIDIKECQVFSTNINYIDFRKNFNKRKIFISKELDYTFIEILDSDSIIIKDYELFKIDFSKDSSDIAILHYSNNVLSFSFGTFKKENDDTLLHNCDIESESFGAPIINRNDNQSIIGIHCGILRNVGLGHFIDTIFCDIKNNYDEWISKENSLNNNFQTLKLHDSFITNLFVLDNNSICSCSTDGTIIFFDGNNFKILGKIKENAEIIYHAKLSNNNIILCCKDGNLKIYKEKSGIMWNFFWNNIKGNIKEYELLQVLNGHQQAVCQAIEINENLIISCGLDTTMKFWNYQDNKFICTYTVIVNDEIGYSTNIIKVNENKIVSAATKANYIKFWDINTFNNIRTINNIVCHWNRNSMKMINANTLFIGGDEYNGIYLIDVCNYQVISLIKDKQIESISTIITLFNGNILIGCKKKNKSNFKDISYSYSLIEYKYNYDEKNLIKVRSKNNAHNDIITAILNLDHNEIVSCSLDKEIKFWI